MSFTRALRAGLDRWLHRHPFEGRYAERYRLHQRCAFGDLDERLLRDLHAPLTTARIVLDLGSGPGDFGRRVARAHPHLRLVAVEPSATYAPRCAVGDSNLQLLRATGECLPLADEAVDLAVCLSSIRHFRDRLQGLRELRRVVRPGGCAVIVELDPNASTARRRSHIRRLRSSWGRLVFTPFVLRPAPSAEEMGQLARDAGWDEVASEVDARQPVYRLTLGATTPRVSPCGGPHLGNHI